MLGVALAAALVLIGTTAPARAASLPYVFVDHLSGAAPSRATASAAALSVRDAVVASSLERDVRALAGPEMRGRQRGTDENARARAFIVERLRSAGLDPLFDGSFEQPTYVESAEGAAPLRYATNAGAVLRAAQPDAEWVVLVAHYDHLGVVDGVIHPGADDNASSVALLLALGDALGRVRPKLRRHVVLLFADAEEPPNIRTERMGSSWFWGHAPLPAERLHLAIVLDLIGGRASPEMEAAGLGNALFVLGAEAGQALAAFARGLPPTHEVEPVFLSLPMIEAMPYVPNRRFARSDYHGLREHLGRPFLFLSTGRTETYHTARDTPETLDYGKLGRITRWVAVLAMQAADAETPLDWRDFTADPRADADTLLRMSAAVVTSARFSWPLRRALAADRRVVEDLRRRWNAGEAPTLETYRALQLASTRLQAAQWSPGSWYFALW